ncbi:MAG TPA: PD-(D/E)XK nuclease family protein [Bryobacteraceae bacterium]|nr:PD-(D/E)XK nuclease family protein [Bryobacteraceae bacterium]
MSEAGIQSRGLHLLSQAKTIRHYEETLAQASGERFNLFEILRVGHYEVRTHSPILTELLSPTGTHGQGSTLLRLFLDGLGLRDFEAEGATVVQEVSIGPLGRIDIVITDRSGTRRIFIENKIYAGLQERQLERYQKYDPKAVVLFLTLRGDKPEGTDNNAVPNLQLVSYHTDILSWLEKCRKEAATAPGVREAITHYIHLLRRLTEQNTSTRMNHELINAVLHDRESYSAYVALKNANSAIRAQVIHKLNDAVEGAVGNQVKLEQRLDGDGVACAQYRFTTPALSSVNLSASFMFENRDFGGCFFGFTVNDPAVASPAGDQIRRLFDHEFEGFDFAEPTQWWPAWKWWRLRKWDESVFAEIQFGSLHKEIAELLLRLKRVADQFEAEHHS